MKYPIISIQPFFILLFRQLHNAICPCLSFSYAVGNQLFRSYRPGCVSFCPIGFDLYRVHVWDTKISDTLGNLIFNEHLNAFDYLLKKLSERNIIPLDDLNESEFQVNVEDFFRVDPENLNAPAVYGYTIKNYLNKK